MVSLNLLKARELDYHKSLQTSKERVWIVILYYCQFLITDLSTLDYYLTYLSEILLAIHEDQLPITGTIAWCKYELTPTDSSSTYFCLSAIFDNFEWAEGFGTRYVFAYS